MIVLHDLRRFRAAAGPAAAMFIVGVGLPGCSGMSDGLSSAFVDPAKYEQYDCKQLEKERKTLSVRAAELQGLMAKADTGTGGAVIGELAYRNDFISNRASLNLANEVWRRDKCAQGGPTSVNPAPDLPGDPNSGPGGRSRNGIY